MSIDQNKRFPLILVTVIGTIVAVFGLAVYFDRIVPEIATTSPAKPAVEEKQGDLATRGGTATVRKSYAPKKDDPKTTNDERNDQPKGHFGTMTLSVHNISSGNTYTLDADVENMDEDAFELHRLYFPKGGWVDFYSCDLDFDYSGYCSDENGNDWNIQGEG